MTNGLDKKEEQKLQKRLNQLNELLTRRGLMGAGESAEVQALALQIMLRLQPTTVEAIDQRAGELVDRFRGIDWADAALARAAA